jgi:hypothetical protein
MELGGIGWFLPLDKNFPESGIGTVALLLAPVLLAKPTSRNREMWGTLSALHDQWNSRVTNLAGWLLTLVRVWV